MPSKRTRLLASTVIMGAVFGAGAASAQQGPSSTTVQEVVVTGSRIPRPNLTSTSPITSVSAQEAKLEGSADTVDLLNELPQTTGSLGNTPNPLSGGGYSTANLRGLGCNRTLVLQDGQRLVPGDSAASCVNLDAIPLALIDHVEVVTGGASAVYGSDAIAGVVNFVMKKNFQGVQLDAQYGFDQHDNGNGLMDNAISDAINTYGAGSNFKQAPGSVLDGRTETLSLTMGSNTEDGKGNVTAYLSYKHAEPISEASRDFGACELTAKLKCTGSANSNLFIDANNSNSYSVAGGPGHNQFVPWGSQQTTPGAIFNSQPYEYLSRGDTRYQGGFQAHYDINSHVQVYSSFNYMDDKSVEAIAPGGSFAGAILNVNCDNPLLPSNATTSLDCLNPTAQNPAGVAQLLIGRRDIEGGPRVTYTDHAQFQGVVGAKGAIDDVWSYNVAASYGEADVSSSTSGFFSLGNLENSLMVQNVKGVPTCESVISGTDPNCVPYNPFVQSVGFGKTASNVYGGVTAAALKYLETPSILSDELTQQDINANIVGQLGKYGVQSPWANEGVGVSFGAEYRREYLAISPDAVNEENLLDGGSGAVNPVKGAYDTKEIYGELLVPLVQDKPWVKDLSMETGYRRADYSSSGTVGSYKFGAQYAPTSDIRFRGSFERAVRAPNVTELYTPETVGNTSAFTTDPCAGPTPAASLQACERSGVTTQQYGHIIDCVAGQCGAATGGNVALRPETSDTTELGFVVTPTFLRNFNLSVDWYNINVMGAVSTLPPGVVLDDCLNSNEFCNLVKRNALGYLWGAQSVAGGGYVAGINANVGYLQTKGMDFESNYRLYLKKLGLQDLGTVDFNFVGTWTERYIVQSGPGFPSYDCAGLFGPTCSSSPNGGVIPAWRHKVRATWNTPWKAQVSLQWRFISGTQNEEYSNQSTFVNELASAGPEPLQKGISDVSYFDLSGSWKVRDNLVLRAGINNLLDKDPPLIDAQKITGAGAPNAFPMYDLEGRNIFVGLTANF